MTSVAAKFGDPNVSRVFDRYPPDVRRQLLRLRKIILATAAATPGVGKIEETLRWGEVAYVTTETGSGSAVRIGWKRTKPGQYAMYFHCQTNLVETFRAMFPKTLQFEGNRALLFGLKNRIPVRDVAYCVAAAFTYRLSKRGFAKTKSLKT